jgi:RNA polymerase sigma factor (sigma-70 family)
MSIVPAGRLLSESAQKTLLYHFCRLRLPALTVSAAGYENCLKRSLDTFHARRAREGRPGSWEQFLDNLYSVDWFVACACLERDNRAWETLFGMRASRVDCLLVDALRARAVRLFPGNEERQESAVAGFWGYLLAGERPGSLPILARYDGQRPLVPWLIRVFQNKHISDLRRQKGVQALPEEELDDHELNLPGASEDRWHEEFRQAGREWLGGLRDGDLLILGLRLRYRLSQRDVAGLLGIHEGNVSRATSKLRDHCLETIGGRLQDAGWTGDDLQGYIMTEMASLLMDEPRLSADHLAALLHKRGREVDLGVLHDEASAT